MSTTSSTPPYSTSPPPPPTKKLRGRPRSKPTSDLTERRREQIRKAQLTYRQRREGRFSNLSHRVDELEAELARSRHSLAILTRKGRDAGVNIAFPNFFHALTDAAGTAHAGHEVDEIDISDGVSPSDVIELHQPDVAIARPRAAGEQPGLPIGLGFELISEPSADHPPSSASSGRSTVSIDTPEEGSLPTLNKLPGAVSLAPASNLYYKGSWSSEMEWPFAPQPLYEPAPLRSLAQLELTFARYYYRTSLEISVVLMTDPRFRRMAEYRMSFVLSLISLPEAARRSQERLARQLDDDLDSVYAYPPVPVDAADPWLNPDEVEEFLVEHGIRANPSQKYAKVENGSKLILSPGLATTTLRPQYDSSYAGLGNYSDLLYSGGLLDHIKPDEEDVPVTTKTIDVQHLLNELIIRSHCLGKSMGIRKRDVETAISLAMRVSAEANLPSPPSSFM